MKSTCETYEELWSEIEEFLNDNSKDLSLCKLNFDAPIASGFRFRYQSEIDKKSYSSIKGERNLSPDIKITSPNNMILILDLVTEGSKMDKILSHFYSLYEITKLSKLKIAFHNGICYIDTKKGDQTIKLDFLGIRKWKLKEAIPKIKELYPSMCESDAKNFFNANKETVRLRASLMDKGITLKYILSNPIKSKIAKDNTEIKIQHISPKTVADNNEKLIIVLEKKITGDNITYLIFDNLTRSELKPSYQDGQTFVYTITYGSIMQNPITGKIRIECSDSFDEKPIRFLPINSEMRKRKCSPCDSDVPLKRPSDYNCPQKLYPESGNADSTIESDGIRVMDTEENLNDANTSDNIEYDGPDNTENNVFEVLQQSNINGSDSCRDSGIHSDNKSMISTDFDSEYNESIQESDEDSDDIEIEGRRRNNQVSLEPINFPPSKRTNDSRLIPVQEDKVAHKIFSEISRIGHDFAFGKEPSDLFTRIEKQLPVVFTLQDDVGDTPLNNAILKGNTRQAERILKTVYDECNWALDLVNSSGHTALILAPACDVPCTFITKLLDAGCSLDKYDDLGKSAIIYAIEYKNTAALEVLLKHIRNCNMTSLVKRMDKVYFSPLHIAVMNGYVDGVNMLLSLKTMDNIYMVDVNERSLMNEETALTIAVERNVEIDIIRLLLSRNDIDVNHKKDNKHTSLHQAIKMKAQEVIVLLKEHGGLDISNVGDSEEDSDDDIELDEDMTSYAGGEACPVVDVSPDNNARPLIDRTANIVNLVAKMENMSLKGTYKIQLIDLLVNGEGSLTALELGQIIRPTFKTLLSKYNDAYEYKKEIADMLERFNCLPNSLGQLFDKLREISREDIITKIVLHFNV